MANSGEPTEVIGVLRAHLEDIYGALDAGTSQNMALDLVDGYRSLRPHQPSRLTAQLTRARDRLAIYLEPPEEETSNE